MKCPTCKLQLNNISFSNITLDVCDCGGIWFDIKELKKSNETPDIAVKIIEKTQPKIINHNKEEILLACPKCENVKMIKCYFARRKVVADQCSKCGGIWLDGQEFSIIYNDTVSGKKQEEFERTLKEARKNTNLNNLKRQCEIEKNTIKKLESTISEMIDISREKCNLSQIAHESATKVNDISYNEKIFEERRKFAVETLDKIENMIYKMEDKDTLDAVKIQDRSLRFKHSVDKFNQDIEALKNKLSNILKSKKV